MPVISVYDDVLEFPDTMSEPDIKSAIDKALNDGIIKGQPPRKISQTMLEGTLGIEDPTARAAAAEKVTEQAPVAPPAPPTISEPTPPEPPRDPFATVEGYKPLEPFQPKIAEGLGVSGIFPEDPAYLKTKHRGLITKTGIPLQTIKEELTPEVKAEPAKLKMPIEEEKPEPAMLETRPPAEPEAPARERGLMGALKESLVQSTAGMLSKTSKIGDMDMQINIKLTNQVNKAINSLIGTNLTTDWTLDENPVTKFLEDTAAKNNYIQERFGNKGTVDLAMEGKIADASKLLGLEVLQGLPLIAGMIGSSALGAPVFAPGLVLGAGTTAETIDAYKKAAARGETVPSKGVAVAAALGKGTIEAVLMTPGMASVAGRLVSAYHTMAADAGKAAADKLVLAASQYVSRAALGEGATVGATMMGLTMGQNLIDKASGLRPDLTWNDIVKNSLESGVSGFAMGVIPGAVRGGIQARVAGKIEEALGRVKPGETVKPKTSLEELGLTPRQYLDKVVEKPDFFKIDDLTEQAKADVAAEYNLMRAEAKPKEEPAAIQKPVEEAKPAEAAEVPKPAETPAVETKPPVLETFEAKTETKPAVVETKPAEAEPAKIAEVPKEEVLSAAEKEEVARTAAEVQEELARLEKAEEAEAPFVGKKGVLKKAAVSQEPANRYRQAVDLGYKPKTSLSETMAWNEIKTPEEAKELNRVADVVTDAYENRDIWEPKKLAQALREFDGATQQIKVGGKTTWKWKVDDPEVARKKDAIAERLKNDGYDSFGRNLTPPDEAVPEDQRPLEVIKNVDRRAKADRRRAKLVKENPSGSFEGSAEEDAALDSFFENLGYPAGATQAEPRAIDRAGGRGARSKKKTYDSKEVAAEMAKPAGPRPMQANSDPKAVRALSRAILREYFGDRRPEGLTVDIGATKIDGTPWELGDNAEIVFKDNNAHVRIRSTRELSKVRDDLVHEILGHFGLSPVIRADKNIMAIIDKLYKADKEYYRFNENDVAILERLTQKYGSEEAARESQEFKDHSDRTRVFKNYSANYQRDIERYSKSIAEDRMLDEWIAAQAVNYDAGSRAKGPVTVVGLVKAAIKRLLSKMGLRDVRQEEIENAMGDAIRAMRKGRREEMMDTARRSKTLPNKPVPVFYSKLQQMFEGAPPKLDNMTGSQWMQWLSGNKDKFGVKSDEIEWSGINDIFNISQNAKIPRNAIVEFLKGGEIESIPGGVQIGEERFGAASAKEAPKNIEWKTSPYSPTDFMFDDGGLTWIISKSLDARQPADAWELRGFGFAPNNFNEIRARSPVIIGSLVDAENYIRSNRDRTGKEPHYAQYQLDGPKPNYAEIAITLPGDRKFSTGHFGGMENILVWIRFNERVDADGKKVLFIEEIQSDWGQQYRKRAVAEKEAEKKRALAGVSPEIMSKYEQLKSAEDLHHQNEINDYNTLRYLEEQSRLAPDPTYTGPNLSAAEFENAMIKWKDQHRLDKSNQADHIRRQMSEVLYRMVQRNSSLGEALSYKRADDLAKWLGGKLDYSAAEKTLKERIETARLKAQKSLALSVEATGILREFESENPSLVAATESVTLPDLVEPAPFITDSKAYTALAIKRAIRYAAERGMDRVAWTTGIQQVARWSKSMRSVLNGVRWGKYDNALAAGAGIEHPRLLAVKKVILDTKQGEVRVYVDGDGKIVDSSTGNKEWNGKPLSEILSNKTNAAEIMSKESGEITGKDLTVGGKGFIDVYGDAQGMNSEGKPAIITQVANDVLRKIGGEKVGKADLKSDRYEEELRNPAQEPDVQPAFDITPAMREKVLFEGQSLFSREALPEVPKTVESVAKEDPMSQLYEHIYGRKEGVEPGKEVVEKPPTEEDGRRKRAESFDIKPEGKLDLFKRKIVDEFQRLAVVQKAIQAKRRISDEFDAYFKMEIMQGKTKDLINKFDDKFYQPLKDEIHKSGLNVRAIGLYLYARHAKERNAQIAKINSEFADTINNPGSGMSDVVADKVIKYFHDHGQTPKLEAIEKQIRRMNNYHQYLLVKSGLVDQKTIDRYNATYRNYVPLKGFQEEDLEARGYTPEEIAEIVDQTNSVIGSAKGFSVSYKPKRAMGRETMANVDEIMANIVTQIVRDIATAGKNEVGQAFLGLVRQNPNDKIWRIEQPEMKDYIDPRSGKVVPRVNPLWLQKEDVMAVYEGGRPTGIKIVDPALRAAMKNMGADTSHAVFRFMGNFNRMLASLITRYSFEFPISNFLRDIQEAVINTTADFSLKKAMPLKVVKDTPLAIKGMMGMLKGKDETLWQQWAQEFAANGGMVEFLDFRNLEQTQKKFIKDLSMMDDNKMNNLKRYLGGVKDFVDNVNTSVENGTRLAFYKNLRENGYTPERAAQAAKNLTVNFNRKGELGSAINSFFIFANAAIQGNRRMLQALNTPKGKAATAALMAGGWKMASMNRAIAGDEAWEKIPLFTKMRNWIVMRPDGTYLKFPLPFNFGVFYSAGIIGDAIASKALTPMEGAASIVGAVWDAFNPLGEGTLRQTVTPTIVRPFFDLGWDKDFAGNPIYPEAQMWDAWKPMSQRAFKGVSAQSKYVAEKLNEITGGTKYLSGGIDVTPEALDYITKQYAGGLGDFLMKSASLAYKAGKAVGHVAAPAEIAAPEKPEPREIPFVRKFYAKPLENATKGMFYIKMNDLRAFKAEHDDLLTTNPKAAKAFMEQNKSKIKAYNISTTKQGTLSLLKKQLTAAEERGDKPEQERIGQLITNQLNDWESKMKDLGESVRRKK